MEHFGFWSLLPPVLAILLAIRTKQVFIALIFGIWLGWVIVSGGNLWTGTLSTVQALVDVFKDDGSTRTIMFSALVGALIAYIQRAGGVNGFVQKVEKWLQAKQGDNQSLQRKWVQWMAWLTGILIFVESSISVLTVGSLYRPVFDKLKISREKLAYIADSSSAPACILFPFNAWGAYVMGLILLQGFQDPVAMMISVFPFNFYPMLALGMVAYIIGSGKDFGPMRKAEDRARLEGKLMADDAQPVVSSEITMMEAKEGVTPKARNMLIPIAIMVLMMPIMLAYTGWGQVEDSTSWFNHTLQAMGKGSGSTAVLFAVLTALIVAIIWYRAQKIMKLSELIDLTLKGIGGLMPIALLMLLAFAIGNVCRSLGTGIYVAEVTKAWLSPGVVPMLVFIISAFIAFSTGTSWGTFAIMIAIAVPMAQSLDAPVAMSIAAVLGGGVFGDHCSPISDTTILSSMAAASDHIDHVKTQLPYALIMGAVATLLYLVGGLILAG